MAADSSSTWSSSASVAGTRLGPMCSSPRSAWWSSKAPHSGLGPNEVRAPSWRMRLAMKTSLTGLRSSIASARAWSSRPSGRTSSPDDRAPSRLRLWPPAHDRIMSAPQDLWRARLDAGRLVFLGQQLGLVHEGVHDLGLRHGADHLAVAEDLALALAGGDADVGLACLARTVDDAAHDRHPHRRVDLGHALLDGVGEREDVDLGAAAGWAGDQVELLGPQAEGAEDGVAGLDLLDRRGGQRHPDGVADALGEQGADADRGLDDAVLGGAGLGDAEVQRVVAALGEQPVGGDHGGGVLVLHRDLDVAEADLLEDADLEHGGFDQCLRGGPAVLGQQLLLQRAGVDADPDGDPAGRRLGGDQLDLVVLLDVAGVDAHPGAAGLDGGH